MPTTMKDNPRSLIQEAEKRQERGNFHAEWSNNDVIQLQPVVDTQQSNFFDQKFDRLTYKLSSMVIENPEF